MERNQTNKVYINPNFKGPLEMGGQRNTWPSIYEHLNVQNIHKYYSQMQNDNRTENKFPNKSRTIYFNPNFKHGRLGQNLDNQTIVSKSKYSLVSAVTSNVDNSSNYREINAASAVYKTDDTFYNQNVKKQTILIDNKPKGVPVIKSRYCIVRKKKLTENLAENKQKNIEKVLKSTVVGASAKILSPVTCYANLNRSLLINQGNEILSKPLEKIAKINLNRYKTVPITYLKNNNTITRHNEYKRNTIIHSHIRSEKHNKFEYPTLQTFNKNRFKVTRLSTKSIANTTELTPKINFQTTKKSVWHNQNKINLTKENFRLNNIPCRLFKKYGKCLRKDYGKCEYLHDKKHVSLCRKFLKGICHDNDCSLSHELTANKMPTCYFYLNGVCTKENCPYVHIKLSDKIKICQSFLRGYCERGDSCTFRHINLQKFKNSKSVNLNATRYLPSKNAKVKKGKVKSSIKKKSTARSSDLKETLDTEGNDVECRYYKEMVTSESSCENINPSRCKLGTLPSFIQL